MSGSGDDSVLTTLMPGFVGTSLPAWLAVRLRGGLGGVCLFAPNIISFPQLRALTADIYAANPRALIAIDEEGGDVTRLHARAGSPDPGNAVLGRLDDPQTTFVSAELIGRELRQVGVNVDFAPSADINSNPDNPVIGVRSFGTEPQRVAEHTAAWVRGLQSTGVAATAKHFPGHGDTSQDSHVALPVVDRSAAELTARELVPFVAAIEAGTQLIMTSHILLPQLDADQPATMSSVILTGLLRDQLGFAGVVVSDALDMAGASGERGVPDAAVRALGAGCDLLCLGTDNTDAELSDIEAEVRAALRAGRLPAERVAQAADRVRTLADDLLAAAPDGDPVPGEPLGVAAVLAAFDLQPSARAWGARPPGSYAVVRLDTRVSPAIAQGSWGPPLDAHRVAAGEPAPDLSPDEPVVVIGRDIHRHDFARAAVDELRSRHGQVLVIDMGWPSDDRRYADVATFGASALISEALLMLLTHG